MMESTGDKLLEVRGLVKYFPITGGIFSLVIGQVKAVDGVSFHVCEGETLGLVGESGCGKSTVGRAVLRLVEPTSGELCFRGANTSVLSGSELRKLRQDMQIIYQDPCSSLNPRMTVGSLVSEPLQNHTTLSGKEIKERVIEMLQKVGLTPYHYLKFPHEFSGGQRQRIGIARALVLRPKLVVCDEPVSALDVSIQSQVLNLLADLQEEFNLTYLFISHDLSVVKHFCDRICVMYLGKIVEMTESEVLYSNPLHPYTKALLSAIPRPDPTRKGERIFLRGEIPSPINPPSGCRFHTRCPYVQPLCRTEEPEFREHESNHFAACHFPCYN
jgi:oligopeptide transport system ATP-binding protein